MVSVTRKSRRRLEEKRKIHPKTDIHFPGFGSEPIPINIPTMTIRCQTFRSHSLPHRLCYSLPLRTQIFHFDCLMGLIHCVPTLRRRTSVYAGLRAATCVDLRLHPATYVYAVMSVYVLEGELRAADDACMYGVLVGSETKGIRCAGIWGGGGDGMNAKKTAREWWGRRACRAPGSGDVYVRGVSVMHLRTPGIGVEVASA
jgi:hypothetical protein